MTKVGFEAAAGGFGVKNAVNDGGIGYGGAGV
jgi:hypothetical protein